MLYFVIGQELDIILLKPVSQVRQRVSLEFLIGKGKCEDDREPNYSTKPRQRWPPFSGKKKKKRPSLSDSPELAWAFAHGNF